MPFSSVSLQGSNIYPACKRFLIHPPTNNGSQVRWLREWVKWVNLRPAVSRSVCPGVRRPSGTCDKFFFHLEISFRHLQVCKFVAPSLTRGRVWKLLYNCFWALPEQSPLGRSPAELTALFCCLNWDSIQFRLGLASAVTLRSKSRRTHGLILLSHLRLNQPGGSGPRISKSR
jgi:hypothetical protein